MNSSFHPDRSRAPILDFLRLIAAFAVLTFHWTGMYNGHFPYGSYGVETFFMISGFVIPLSLAGRSRWQFAKARFRRLWPTFVVCLALTLLVAPASMRTIAANFTMLPHLIGAPYVDAVYWSLMFEIIFYTAICVIVGNRTDRLIWFAWAWLAIALVPWPHKIATLLIHDYAPFFIVGIASYKRSKGLFLCALVVAEIWAFKEARADRWTCVAIVGVSAVIVYIAPMIKLGRRTSSVALACGGISYPLYLLHDNFGSHLPIHGLYLIFVLVAICYVIWRIDRRIKFGAIYSHITRAQSEPSLNTGFETDVQSISGRE